MYNKKAFSLVEMLMALLVASLLMAALAPVMTKRMNENLTVATINNGVQQVEQIVKCSRTDENIKLEDIASSENRVSFLLVSGGGGGGGASGAYKSSAVDFSSPAVSSSTYSSKILNLNKDMTDFELETLIGGGGGGGGGTYATAGNAEYCKNLGNGKTDTSGHTGTSSNQIFVYDSVSGLCITKYTQKGTSGCIDYTGEKLTLPICTYQGSVSACHGLSNNTGSVWSMPAIKDMAQFNSLVYTCDNQSGGSYDYCPTLSGEKYYYAPYHVWSSDEYASRCDNGAKTYAAYILTGGVWKTGSWWLCDGSHGGGKVNYASLHCVTKPFLSFSGGGGGGAPGITSKDSFSSTVKDLLKKAINENLEGGSIKIEAGKGGDKGTKGSDGKDGGAGGNGGESCITIYSGPNASGSEVFKVCAPGGNGGSGAVSSLNYKSGSSYYAKGGAAKAINSCYYQSYNGTKTYFNCSAEGTLGEHGYGAESKTETTWGHGGASALNLTTFAGTTSVNGTTLNSISYPGAGGSGGRASLSGEANYTVGEGGSGSSGFVKITYKNKKDGAGGGGGAGGSVARIKNIIFTKSYYDCKVTVGKGGTGGNAGGTQSDGTSIKGENGTAGGESSITCDGGNTIYTVFGGKGGSGSESPLATVDTQPGNGGEAYNAANVSEGKIEGLKSSMVKIYLGEKGETPDKTLIDSIKIGGAGGKSGSGAFGGCGGRVENVENCIKTSSISPDGKGFKADDVSDAYQFYGSNVKTVWDSVLNSSSVSSFGTAGAGGGGGTYLDFETIGKGGDGMPGYVCVFYTKAKN